MAQAEPMIDKSDNAAPDAALPPSTRRKLMIGIAVIVLLGAVAYGAWHLLVGSRHVSTDNAYVGADTAQVTSMVAGQVAQVLVSDAQTVHRGDILVRIDDRDARIALTDAQAALAKATRQFGQTTATGDALLAQVNGRDENIAAAKAQLSAAQASFAKAAVDLDRRRKLAPNGAVSGDELTSAINAHAAARGALENARAMVAHAVAARNAAQGDLKANRALTNGTSAATNPDVLAAHGRVDQARLDLERTVIRAAVDGVVTGRAVQVGQRLAPGTAVMKIVPVQNLYVDANFKEGQLARVRPGQKVTLTSDLYGDDVVYRGTVVGLTGGTGSAFALIPAQNATGNWIKVVQRLPVRITIDPRDLAAHPLRVGLSMTADIGI